VAGVADGNRALMREYSGGPRRVVV
jgi:hypothetical protein